MTQSTLIDEIKQALAYMRGEWTEKKGLWSFSATIAERKAFLSKKKLTYSSKLRIDDQARTIHYSELLTESGSGISSDSGFDSGSTGFGFKTESYNTFGKARQGTIEEQSVLFGKDYSYQFDFSQARIKIQEIAARNNYVFEYQILPVK
jgi:hypothetical protein